MLAEELQIVNPTAPSWQAIRPLLTIVTRLEQDDAYVWHGWNQQQIAAFLAKLPDHCSLVAAVWSVPEDDQQPEQLEVNCVCEVKDGSVHTVRTFEALKSTSLPAVEQLESGYEHALEIMHAVRLCVAPVAWALFTDKTAWNEWIYMGDDSPLNKGELLASLAHRGRCVLMGNQVPRHEA